MECIICFDDLNAKPHEIICPECNLELHTECTSLWLERNVTCPQCRTFLFQTPVHSPSQAIVTFPLDSIPLDSIVTFPPDFIPPDSVPLDSIPPDSTTPTPTPVQPANNILFFKNNKVENFFVCFFFFIFTILLELQVYQLNLSSYYYIIFPITNFYLLLISSKKGKKLSRWVKFPIFTTIIVFLTILLITNSENSFHFLTAWIFTANTFNIFYSILFFLFF
jgi:hypothetical protein